MSICTQWVDRGVITCRTWASQLRRQCIDWAEQTRKTCSERAQSRREQCDRWADEGHDECSEWADEGHNDCCDWWPCSWACDALVWIAEWVCKGWHWVANWVCKAWHTVVEWVCIAWTWIVEVICVAFSWFVTAVCVVWSWIAKLVCIVWTNVLCALRVVTRGIRGLFRRRPKGAKKIEHVFVLMMENRSFDHMLGLAQLDGMDAHTGQPRSADDLRGGPYSNRDSNNVPVQAGPGAEFKILPEDKDPPHEFTNALHQLCGPAAQYPDAVTGGYPTVTNAGFVLDYTLAGSANPHKIMRSFSPRQLPILTTLAREFAVCDRWFSSMPGPTWPNRFFAHAASSGGLDDSPSGIESGFASLIDGFRFWNGSIFDRLESACIDWGIVEGDEFPQVFAMSGMTTYAFEGHFTDQEDFASEVAQSDYAPKYTFIEPNYGNILPTTSEDYTCGTSQHPLDDVTRGEQLIKDVYEAIRNSPHWDKSLLIVTWDEHGGFYDHVVPPGAVAPGDPVSQPGNVHQGFDFRQLGTRVPAVVISPWIARGVVDHTVYDHSSIPATIEQLFGFRSLTERDRHANNVLHLLSLSSPRDDAPTTLPPVAESGWSCTSDPPRESDIERAAEPDGKPRPIKPHVQGFLYLAMRRQLAAIPTTDWQAREALMTRVRGIRTDHEARLFISQARQSIRAHKRNRRETLTPKRSEGSNDGDNDRTAR